VTVLTFTSAPLSAKQLNQRVKVENVTSGMLQSAKCVCNRGAKTRRASKNVACANIFFTFYTLHVWMLCGKAYMCALLTFTGNFASPWFETTGLWTRVRLLMKQNGQQKRDISAGATQTAAVAATISHELTRYGGSKSFSVVLNQALT